jgi:predicted O-methyltransferase YrrM
MKKILWIVVLFFSSFLHAEKSAETLTDHVCTVLPSLQGWCSKEKAINFIDLVLKVKPKVCVEIGVFGGSSLFPVASALKFREEGVVIGIDPWDKLECIRNLSLKEDEKHLDWWSKIPMDSVYQSYLSMLKRYELEKYCKTIKKTAEKTAHEIHEIDILYMDAIYSEKKAEEILNLYLPKVRSGGYVWLNDALGEKSFSSYDLILQSCNYVTEIDDGNCILFQKHIKDVAPIENTEPAALIEEHVAMAYDEVRIKQEAFAFMNQLQGWCTERKASTLIDIILKTRPNKIVEIGVYGGKSVVPMACALKAVGKGKIYGIDPWDNGAAVVGVMNQDNLNYWSTINLQAIKAELVRKIFQFGLEDSIVLIESTSEAAAPIQDIDILHIDGNHSDITSYFDVTKWAPLVKSGGWIILDDMTWYENGTFTTARAAEWLDTHCKKFAEFKDVSVWGIWIKS